MIDPNAPLFLGDEDPKLRAAMRRVRVWPRVIALLSRVMPIAGVTVFPFIVVPKALNPRSLEDVVLLRHEAIHIEQQREGWVVGFYLRYALDYLRARRQGMSLDDAYHCIRYEQEAFEGEAQAGYLSHREPRAWALPRFRLPWLRP